VASVGPREAGSAASAISASVKLVRPPQQVVTSVAAGWSAFWTETALYRYATSTSGDICRPRLKLHPWEREAALLGPAIADISRGGGRCWAWSCLLVMGCTVPQANAADGGGLRLGSTRGATGTCAVVVVVGREGIGWARGQRLPCYMPPCI